MDNEMEFDGTQCAALEAMVPHAAVSVVGMSGSGKTSLLIEKVARILEADTSTRVAVLSPDRRAATELRNAITSRVGVAGENLVVKSVSAFAFDIVSTFAQAVGRREPQLISGPDQDVYLKAIFDSADPRVGNLLTTAGIDTSIGMAQLPAFRAEFRDLITRTSELGLGSEELAALGLTYGEPIWVAGAEVMKLYEETLALEASAVEGAPDRADHARIVAQAAAHLSHWERQVASGGASGAVGIAKPRWEWVFVDDLSDATLSLLGLLRQLQNDGAALVTFSNPDDGVQGYRGGVAHFAALVERSQREGGCGARRVELGVGYRCAGPVGAAMSRIAQAIHVGSTARQRKAELVGNSADLVSEFFANPDEEIRHIGAWLRRAHIKDGVSYSDMAVITRSRSLHASWRSALVRMGIPVAPLVSGTALRGQRAVAALLEFIRIAIADPVNVDTRQVISLLGGKLVGIDPLRLMVLQEQLHGWEISESENAQRAGAEQDIRSNDVLIHSILSDLDGDPVSHVAEFAKVRAMIIKVRRAYRRGANAEEVLWEAWEAAGVAENWQELAISDDPRAATANEDLDAVMQVFRVAQRLADRNPLAATVHALLDVLENQDLPEDSIARAANGTGEVTIATPSSLIGRSFSHVAIGQLQDSVWPNMRVRHPLTKVEDLVSVVVSGMLGSEPMKQTIADVFDDEYRLFHFSLGRAKKRVLLTALASEESMPSRIFDILGVSTPEENAPTATTGIHPHSSDAFVGYLRRALDFPDEGLSQAARNALAQLAHSGVGSADPQSWVDQYKYSGGSHPSQVTVSPSRVEGALECPLKEFLNSAGARDQQDTIKAEIGTLIHSIAEAFPDGGAEQIRAEFERRWGELSVREDVAGRRLKASARKKLEMLIDYLNSARERLEGREVKTEASAFGELEGIRVSAQIDRLESEGGGNWRVVDFKTGDYLPAVSSAESNPQMLIYQWLVNSGAVKGEKRAHSIGAHLIRMSRNVSRYRDDTQREVGASGMKLAEEMIRTSAALLAGPHLEARVSDACHTCRYFFVCPAQGGKRVFE